MQVGVLGINHKSASLRLREQVAQVCLGKPDEIVLSTCHRTEIYFSHDNLAEKQFEIFDQLKKQLNHSSEHAFYSFFGSECFYHLACVTAGLDSALLGETDIQKQVKNCYERARLQGSLTSELHYLFQKSLKLAKNARSSFPLFQSTIHLERIVFELVSSIVGNAPSLLMIGNSEINRKIIHYFSRRKKGKITLVSRDLQKAYPFAMDYGLTLKNRDELLSAHLYEGVIAATDEGNYLISSLPSSSCLRLMIDLSVPRSLDPSLSHDPSRSLFNMEQIGELCTQAHRTRSIEVEQVKKFLGAAVIAYTDRFRRKNLLSI
jgi:glutamyl-tRNA reductase